MDQPNDGFLQRDHGDYIGYTIVTDPTLLLPRLGNLLVSVNNGSQVDLVLSQLPLENGENPAALSQLVTCDIETRGYILRRICRIHNHSIFSPIIHDQVGVVVTTSGPLLPSSEPRIEIPIENRRGANTLE